MDRDYWRSEPTKRLIEEARTKGCELCVALGERLKAADDEASEEADKWENIAISNDNTISDLRTEIEELHAKLEQLEAQLNKETKK
jgi:predicted RNase H-like nuclease (RuvC/YqgF family)